MVLFKPVLTLFILHIHLAECNNFIFGPSLPYVLPVLIILGIIFVALWALICTSWIRYFIFLRNVKKKNNKVEMSTKFVGKKMNIKSF